MELPRLSRLRPRNFFSNFSRKAKAQKINNQSLTNSSSSTTDGSTKSFSSLASFIPSSILSDKNLEPNHKINTDDTFQLQKPIRYKKLDAYSILNGLKNLDEHISTNKTDNTLDLGKNTQTNDSFDTNNAEFDVLWDLTSKVLSGNKKTKAIQLSQQTKPNYPKKQKLDKYKNKFSEFQNKVGNKLMKNQIEEERQEILIEFGLRAEF